ncbi:SGNH/GDSL hydrolase family protein [Rubrivivax sp. JA1024]|nr:SGNH/GDSL hydrolase family protein [Rubrivivax sp. JA1024]
MLLAATALAACGGGGGSGDDAPSTPVVAPGAWAVLGSSTAAGVGASDGKNWVTTLGSAMQPHGVRIDNLARAGLQSSQALPSGSTPPGQPAPLEGANVDAALALRPKLVLLSFPTNDAVAGVPAQMTVANWKAVAAAAAEAGAATLVLSTQPRNHLSANQLETLRETDRLGQAAFGECWVALREALSDSAGGIAAAYRAGDGIHLNDAGHALVGQRTAAVLASGRCVRLAP